MGAARLDHDDFGPSDEDDFDRPIPDHELDDEQRARREARQARREAGQANRARLRSEAQAAIDRAGPPRPKAARKARTSSGRERTPLVARKLPDPKDQLKTLLGDAAGTRAWRDLRRAAEHIDEGRPAEAQGTARDLYNRVPEVIEVAEVWGLTLYGLGRWSAAVDVLEEVRESTGRPDNNPVLADAHRALGHWDDVEVLWAELSEASPSSAIVTEGRIVTAGARADRGELAGAIALLAKGFKRPKRAMDHHLRRAYALADLYERAGERPRAKELFAWIAHQDPEYLDTTERSR